MVKVHILTEGLATPNGRAFLIPILYQDRALRDLGIHCRLFYSRAPELTQCDVLIVDSKFYRQSWTCRADTVLEQLRRFRMEAGKLLWFDTTDSAGTLQAPVVPEVDLYYKSQLLRDKTLYQRRLYGGRLYTDYYHTEHDIVDSEPEYSAVMEAADLKKLRVSWNSALANYTLLGPAKSRLYSRFKWRYLIKPPTRWVSPSLNREIPVSSRFGVSYPKATVRYQRERVRALLADKINVDKLGRRAYLQELEGTSVAVSPFGWGEITLRDFEVFLCGCLLIKPDMDSIETWPDLFQNNVTMLAHQWGMGDFLELVEESIGSYQRYVSIAANGQELYRECLAGPDAAQIFAQRFFDIVGERLGD